MSQTLNQIKFSMPPLKDKRSTSGTVWCIHRFGKRKVHGHTVPPLPRLTRTNYEKPPLG